MKFEMQEKFFNTILNQLNCNKISQAYLIELNDFTDVEKFLDIFVKLLFCPKNNLTTECSDCEICRLIDENNYPDLKVIDTDGAFIKKEQLLEIKESFVNKSIYNNKQIYVIKDASKLNLSSGNTMLKFLEEPEDNIIAILLTKNRYHVLETILSRCQIFSLEDNRKKEFDSDFYQLVKTLFLKNKAFLSYNDLLNIIPNRVIACNKLSDISRYLFLVIHHKQDLLSEILYLSEEQIFKIILIIEKYLSRFQYNLNYKLALDCFIVEINEVIT